MTFSRARSGFSQGARAFRHRNYRLFYVGQTISMVGTWMQQVAQAWLVLKLTNDPLMLGLTTAAAFSPVLVLGLFGGLIADALPKRKTLIATQAAQMVLAFVLFGLVATNAVQVWHILVMALLLGITNAVDMPTRQSFVMEMTGPEDVANAVALNSALFNATRIVGPAVAGLAIGAFGMAQAFLLNGLSFIATIVAYAAMREQDLATPPTMPRPHSVREVRNTLAEGLAYVRRTELVLMVVVTVGVVSTLGMNFGVMIPAFASGVLHTDAAGFGFLMAVTGIGSLTASLAIAFSGRVQPSNITRGAFLLGLALVLAAFLGGVIGSYALTLGAMWLVGFGAIGMAATANTTVQLAAPNELRGRVISVYTTVFVGSTPFGGLLTGWLMSTIGIANTLAVTGAGCTVTAILAAIWLRRLRARAALPATIEA